VSHSSESFIRNNYRNMKKENKLGVALGLGIGIGSAVGVATDNLGLWISVGVAIGAGVGMSYMQKGSKEEKEKKLDTNGK